MSETRASGGKVKFDAKSISQGKAAESGEMRNQSVVQPRPYRVLSIEQEDWEASRNDGTWYMYVVSNGKSTITGHRPGPRKQVVEHAEWFVAELNTRSGRDCKSVLSWRRGRPARKPATTDDQ